MCAGTGLSTTSAALRPGLRTVCRRAFLLRSRQPAAAPLQPRALCWPDLAADGSAPWVWWPLLQRVRSMLPLLRLLAAFLGPLEPLASPWPLSSWRTKCSAPAGDFPRLLKPGARAPAAGCGRRLQRAESGAPAALDVAHAAAEGCSAPHPPGTQARHWLSPPLPHRLDDCLNPSLAASLPLVSPLRYSSASTGLRPSRRIRMRCWHGSAHRLITIDCDR